MHVTSESPPARQKTPEAPEPEPLRQFRAEAVEAAAESALAELPLLPLPLLLLLLLLLLPLPPPPPLLLLPLLSRCAQFAARAVSPASTPVSPMQVRQSDGSDAALPMRVGVCSSTLEWPHQVKLAPG